MKTGKTLHGSAKLIFDAVDATTHISEGFYRNISAAPWPLGEAPQGAAKGIAGFAHSAVRGVNQLTRSATDRVLGHLSPVLDRALVPGPHREAIIAALY